MQITIKKIEKHVDMYKTTLWTRFVNHNFAKYLTYIFCRMNISPNIVTVLSCAIAVLGAYILIINAARLTLLTVVLVYIVWNISYAFDSVDGQLARVTGMSTKFGEWLDHSLDPFNKFIVISSLFYVNFTTVPNELKLYCFVIYAVAVGAVLLLFNATMYKNLLFGEETENPAKMNAHVVSFLGRVRVFSNLTDIGLTFLFIFLLAWPRKFLFCASIYYSFYFLSFFAYVFVRYMKNNHDNAARQ